MSTKTPTKATKASQLTNPDAKTQNTKQKPLAKKASPEFSGGWNADTCSNEPLLTITEEYRKLNHIDHILTVPGMYLGNVLPDQINMDVYDKNTNKIVNKTIEYIAGLYKIFDEAIVNARDHSVKDPTMTELRVEINQEEGSISVYNNGTKGIPVEIHPDWTEEGKDIYIPEGLFTSFMCSGSFSRQKKTVGAKNGYGVKLVSVMSTRVEIEVVDANNKKKFNMTTSNNMRDKSEPIITNLKGKIHSYVKIKFIPDYKRFGVDGLTDDMMNLFVKRVYDIAAVTNVNVFLNNEKINIKGFEEYVKMFFPENESCPFIYDKVNDRWEIGVVFDSESGFKQKSYVNGICTFQGGNHVNHVTDGVVSKLHALISEKNKTVKIKPSIIKDNLTFFINSEIDDPDFPSQTKEYMSSKVADFGSRCPISDNFIKLLSKTGIVDEIVRLCKAKEQGELKNNNGKKKATLKGFSKLNDATNAGTRYGKDCTLILTEGDSAKPYGVVGTQVLGQEFYGVFPLKGKLLNVREATIKQLKENEEINSIIQIMGLKYGTVYEDVNTLRYGKILILTDQDLDGSHIKGLVMNFIEYHWPSLAKIVGFITSMKTPLLKVWKNTDKKKQNPIIFYSEQEYELWKETNNTKLYTPPKYYKGLGTSTEKEAAEAFKDFKDKILYYGSNTVENDTHILRSIFAKETVNFRKEWLKAYDKNLTISPNEQYISYTDFVNKDLIHFSNYDIERSIPSSRDGFKISLRKILFAAFKENLTNREVRVAELAASTVGKAAYHHGEMSLQKAIVGMAQDFVGSNNISWLLPNGAFGDRTCGGTNAASSRYIHTQLNPITMLTFRKEDAYIYQYALDDNGKPVEPEAFAPVICNILINGAKGIGTGFSTTIPCYNPQDIINNLKSLIKKEETYEMDPWYRGFKGTIVKNEHKNGISYDTFGIYEIINENTIVVDELPIGLWTDDYKEFLDKITCDDVDKIQNNHLLKSWESKCGNNTIHFTLTFLDGKLQELKRENSIEKKLDLVRKLCITNMHLYDTQAKLKKYESVGEILTEFYEYRLGMYVKRKEYYTKVLENKLKLISWKIKFIDYYIDEKIVMTKNKKALPEENVIQQLVTHGFPKLSNDFEDPEKTYDYVLDVKLFDITEEKKNKLKGQLTEKQDEYDTYVNTPVEQIWLNEIDEIEKEYIKQLEDRDDDVLTSNSKNKKGKNKKVVKNTKKKNNK